MDNNNKQSILTGFKEAFHCRSVLSIIALFLVVFASIITITGAIILIFSSDSNEETSNEATFNNCNVAGIELHGEIFTYIPNSNQDENGESINDETSSEDILYYIKNAELDERIKAIILEIDSYGGSPVAGEEIAKALKATTKPTIAFIRGTGTSAAYMSASGADEIFASIYSDIGGIGVTMSYVDNVIKNQKEGLTYIPLSSGKFKDTGSVDKALSQEEKDYLMRDVKIMYQNFIKLVSENRNLDIEKVKELSDGSSMLGEMALENGLIDQIGGIDEVENYLKEKIGEDVETCW